MGQWDMREMHGCLLSLSKQKRRLHELLCLVENRNKKLEPLLPEEREKEEGTRRMATWREP